MDSKDPKQKFIKELEKTLLDNPDWYVEVSSTMHHIAQKLTIVKLKEFSKTVQAPVVETPPIVVKKPTLLQLYEGKKKRVREVS